MTKKMFNQRTCFRFKHFSHNGFAIFSVLGREVIIGVLAIPTLAYAKADGISTDMNSAADSLCYENQRLDEVVVTGSHVPLTQLQSARIVSVVTRDEIERAAAGSINDVLKLVTGVDVRQRSGFGVQTDISVRGGNFDQTTILLNGANITDPHTGHYSADFPVSPDDIERIEVLEGGYESGLCGVINVITTHSKDEVLANFSGGSYGYANVNVRATKCFDRGFLNATVAAQRSDGAVENSAFSSKRCFVQGGVNLSGLELEAQMGYSFKPYEANTFYGAASTDQWDSNERLISSVKATLPFNGKGALEASAYWNRWYDHYQWHRNNPVGENFHQVDAAGGAVNGWFESVLGKTSIGVDLRNEIIWSTKLGQLQDESKWRKSGGHEAQDDIFYKYHDARKIWKATFEHHIVLSRMTISPAVTYFKTSDIGRILPALNVSYRLADGTKFFASWNMALRMPTFTDLYYSGANIEGNSDLKPERTSDFQFGLRRSGVGYALDAQLFYSHKTDMIDWVTTLDEHGESDGVFRSINFQMHHFGGEINLSLLPREWFGERCFVRQIGVRYAYLSEHSRYSVDVLQSKYAMEYLRNKLLLSADGRLYRQLELGLAWRWQDRTGENNSPYALLDARLSWQARHFTVYLEGTNIFNKQYFDYATIPQPGTQIIAGLRLKF